MTTQSHLKLNLPRIEHVALRRFSLFTANPDAEFDCNEGVTCLIGANGIGKSTLLSAINFCLTGIVSDPSRAFDSMEEYYRYSRSFSDSYFRGRISGTDEDDAEITVTFRVGEHRYSVTRGLFEPDELRGFTRVLATAKKRSAKAENGSRSERHQHYIDCLVKDAAVSTFEEFVFLQHFLFTFDEQRKTLFWNPRIIDRVLYRAFGVQPDMAKRADNMWREIEQEDSRVRNYQWEATKMRRRINEIQAQGSAGDDAQKTYDALVKEHEKLSERFKEESELLEMANAAIRDASLHLAEHSVREAALRDDYARIFDERLRLRPPVQDHPLIDKSVHESICGLCGSEDPSIAAAIKAKVHGSTCPLCSSKLKPAKLNEADSLRLKEIDKEISKVKIQVRDVLATLAKLRADHERVERTWRKTRDKLDEFDRLNALTLDKLRVELNQGSKSTLQDYRQQLAAVERDKKKAYDKREKLKTQRIKLQKELERQYRLGERQFLPMFSGLATKFLGMPLTVQFESGGGRDLQLIVSVRGTARRHQQNLSESQKFFLDIALRMALTQYMSSEDSKGGLLIDTPEGSLDIAYEKRAGDMLAMFSGAGHPILMSANLNSSQLLLALAKTCGRSNLTLCKMTDWAELSQVQQDEEALFVDAYSRIDREMGE